MAQPTTRSRGSEAVSDTERAPRRRITKRKVVEERATSYFDALAARDVSVMGRALVRGRGGRHRPYGILRGKPEILGFFRGLFAALPDVETTVERVAATAHLAAVEWRMAGHFTGAPFMDIEPTGRRVDIRGVDLLEIEDGQIVSNAAYYDGAAFARQVGMLPSEGSGADRAMKGAFNAVTRLRRRVA